MPTCSGPHPELTQAWSRHCACASEWALHAYVMAGSLAVLAYLLLNIARRLLLQAAAQAQWRSLFAGTLTVLAPCDLRGRLVIHPPSSSSTSPRWPCWEWGRAGPLLPRATSRVTPSSPEPSAPPALEDEGEHGHHHEHQQAKGDGSGNDGHENAPDGAGAGGEGSGSTAAGAAPAPGPQGHDDAAERERQEAFIRRRVEETMRKYERAAWAKGLLAVGLLVAAGLLISLAPQFLDYRP